MKIKIKKTRDGAIIPTKGTAGAAGYDLYSLESVYIPAHCTVKLDIGIAIKIPTGYAGFIHERSGMGFKGFSKHGGLIDEDFIGSLCVILCNTRSDIMHIKRHDRIAQLVIQKVENIEFEEVEELDKTDRNEGGFGSTGE